MFDIKEAKIAVVGLGYVGLPLAIEFGKYYPTIGLDTKTERILELTAGEDSTREVDSGEIAKAKHLLFTNRPEQAAQCNVYIITVPTPIDRYKRPDLSYLETASSMVGGSIRGISLFTNPLYIPVPRKRSACRRLKRVPVTGSTRIFL